VQCHESIICAAQLRVCDINDTLVVCSCLDKTALMQLALGACSGGELARQAEADPEGNRP
jgi:hypothetical protein